MEEKFTASDINAFLQSQNITWFEIIAIQLVFLMAPMHMVVRQYFLTGEDWQQVDPFWSTSLTIALFSFILLVLDILFHKPYLPMIFGCHQNVCRTFRLFGRPFSLCSRCTGVLVGVWLTPFLFSPGIAITSIWLLFGTLPLIIDGLIQKHTTYESTNKRRFMTGLLFSPALLVGMGYFYYGFARVIIYFYYHLGYGLGIL